MTGTGNPYGEFGQNGHDGEFGQNGQNGQNSEFGQRGQNSEFGQHGQNSQNSHDGGYGQYPRQTQEQYAQYATGWGGQQSGMARDAGFFSALFDFSFRKYATPSIVKMVYILITVVMTIGVAGWALTALVSAFSYDAGLGAMLLIVGIPIVLLVFCLQLALFRMLLEAGLALVRAAQSLQNLEQRG